MRPSVDSLGDSLDSHRQIPLEQSSIDHGAPSDIAEERHENHSTT